MSTPAEPAAPAADLKALGDRLVGTWTVSGQAEADTTWKWMEDGFFLMGNPACVKIRLADGKSRLRQDSAGSNLTR
jgi:hypothetical protein